MFFDQAKIHVAAGNGGNGCVSFRREKHVPRGGPDGGDGGHGGDVVLFVDPQLRDLQLFTYKVHFKAGTGQGGMGARKHGSNGETVRIPVPVGTQVWWADEAREASAAPLLADLVHPGQEMVIAHGGGGGRGNTRFTNSTHQAPKFSELGEEGESGWLNLSLKLMADAGLAGLPNAGKSSLLRRLSNAKPKVADYPFTTVEPMLGVVDWSGEGDVFTLADVPGLLEGASDGVGLGHEFLAHLERCFLLVHVVDITGSSGVEPLEGFRVILHELDAHAGGLAEKPQLVLLNKIDALTPEAVEQQREVLVAEVERLRRDGHPAFTYMVGEDAPLARQLVWPVSATTGAGLKALLHWVGPLLRELGAGREAPETAVDVDSPWHEVEPVRSSGGHAVYRPSGTSERVLRGETGQEGLCRRGRGRAAPGEEVRPRQRRSYPVCGREVRPAWGVCCSTGEGRPAGGRGRRRRLRLRVQLSIRSRQGMTSERVSKTVVVKVGSSTLTTKRGTFRLSPVAGLVAEVCDLHAEGHRVLLVSSGAVSSGMGVLEFKKRPTEVVDLQAAAAVGQGRLFHIYTELFAHESVVTAQVLLTAFDVAARTQYLNARNTLNRLLDWGVVPIINENDTTSTDELCFGDNDTLAAQVALLVKADLLVLLTDTDGLYTADPNSNETGPTDHQGRRPERAGGGADRCGRAVGLRGYGHQDQCRPHGHQWGCRDGHSQGHAP